MSWWSRLIGGRSDSELKPQRLDYLKEALMLERQGDLDAALTSYRLAHRDKPDDVQVLENMAIVCSKMGRTDEAVRWYRRALDLKPTLPAAHYGLAFILLKRGDRDGAKSHLEGFLTAAPGDPHMSAWVDRARTTLEQLNAPVEVEATDPQPPASEG
ncbi:MAG: tetratricopeptide repeat protein [Gemmatimonadaceae bacterium]